MELAKIIVYLKNRSPTKPLLDTIFWKSLYEKKSDFFNLRIIKSFVYYYNIETETELNRRTKSDPKIRQTKLIGYSKRFSQYVNIYVQFHMKFRYDKSYTSLFFNTGDTGFFNLYQDYRIPGTMVRSSRSNE
jgi:hypothetical protein